MNADLDWLIERLIALAPSGRRVLLGITGAPGAGKTTLARALVSALDARLGAGTAAFVPMDGFHLADVELERLGRRGRKGAPDTFDAAGYAALLRRLHDRDDEVVYAPAFERDLEQALAGAIPVPRTVRLVVTEGNYLLLDEGPWSAVRAALDEVWFVEADDAARTSSLVARHETFGKPAAEAVAWVQSVDAANARLVASTRDRADLIVRTY